MALADTLKKIPVPVWLGLGGAGLGLGWAYLRDKNEPEAIPPEGAELTPIAEEYYGEGYMPVSPGPVYASPTYDTGETVGAVGQTGLETLGGFFTDFLGVLPALLEAGRPYDGIPQSQPPTVVINPPAPQPAPQPNQPAPGANKPAGYHAGGNVGSGTVKRNFNGASGWTEIGTPDNRFRDFHVAYPSRVLQRWRGWGTGAHVPKAKRGDWNKIWEGRW